MHSGAGTSSHGARYANVRASQMNQPPEQEKSFKKTIEVGKQDTIIMKFKPRNVFTYSFIISLIHKKIQ